MESVIKFLQKQSFYEENFKNKSNISKHEWQDILNLKKNKDIIIKEADKGGAVVIMNTQHYFKMISDHLNDETTYKMVESNCDTKVMKGITKIIEKYKDNLTKKEKEYLISFSYNTSNFYGLPKIHKSKLIQNAIKEQQKEYVHIIEPSDLKLRPIVAGPICPTRPLSNLIDILLKPFLLQVKSYVKDNLDFLSKCSRENYEDTLLVTFDVVSLYTNIPHTFGLEALDYWLENHPESLHARFNKEFVLECAKFILQNNNMKFNNEYYNQIKSTAMGTIFAPTYATLSMGYLEIKLYSVCTFKYGELLAKYIKENWNRFLDDCYTVLRSSEISPEELLLTLNSINPSIQFTMEYSKDQIPLLDILIKRHENGIWMDLYHKPTDTQRCLPFTSSHPNHCKRNIPFCLTRRICTIAENNTEKLKNLENLIQITLIFIALLNPRLFV